MISADDLPRPYRLGVIASDDPYPYYRRLRNEDPAHYSELEDIWVLTRFEDVSAAFKDWKTWSSQRRGNLLNDIPARIGKTLGTTDLPAHTFARGVVDQTFTPKRVEQLSSTVADLARRLTREARERGSIEFAADISAPFNAAILGEMFGVPRSNFIRLRHWLDDFFKREPTPEGEESKQVIAMKKLNEYLDELAGDRLVKPGDDLMSAMLTAEKDGRKLTREQVVVTTMTFLTAGFESTNNLFTNLAYALAAVPGLYADFEPELIDNFIEEGMRWDAAAQGFVRTPTHDVEIHGKRIPEDAQVLLHIGSANRDERAFDDPDRFDPRRKIRRHLGMGLGKHFCVGAPLGRLMARSLFAQLLPASRRWEVDLAASERVTTPNFRGFTKLPLVLGD